MILTRAGSLPISTAVAELSLLDLEGGCRA